MRIFAWALTCALSLACNTRDIGPIDPHINRAFSVEIAGDGVVDVDVLFVIDNSGSMREEQTSLRREIPLLIEGLTNPPTDEGGAPRWNAVESLRVAVVTTDLGTGGIAVPRVGTACNANAGEGDGGQLRVDGTCSPNSILTWEMGEDTAVFAEQVGCVADAGTTGCGLEQPLAAAARALDDANGFPRADALLAVVVLSDEEDCSLSDPVTFFGGPENGLALNQKCVREPGLLEPVEGLLATLTAGRDSDLFLFAALVGVPEDLQESTLSEMLADGRMAYNFTSDNDLGLVPACESFDRDSGMSRGQAAPGRRYIELAQQIEGSLVRSICAESFQPAITELTARIGGRVSGVCTTRSLVPDEDGAVECEVRETLPEGMRCLDLVARTLHEVDVDGRDVCTVAQAVRGQPSGWRYTISEAMCEQVQYTPDAVPPLGASVSLQCLVDVVVPGPDSPTG